MVAMHCVVCGLCGGGGGGGGWVKGDEVCSLDVCVRCVRCGAGLVDASGTYNNKHKDPLNYVSIVVSFEVAVGLSEEGFVGKGFLNTMLGHIPQFSRIASRHAP